MIRSVVPYGEDWSLWPALGLTCLAVGLTGIAGLRFTPPAEVSLVEAPLASSPSSAQVAPPPRVVTATAAAPPADCPPSLAFHFAPGAASPSSSPEVEVGPFMAWLTRHPDVQVVVDGHADANGTVARNLALSHARAAGAARWLVERGLPGSRITARGFGAYQPLPGEDQAADRNRRVEVRVVGHPGCARGDEP